MRRRTLLAAVVFAVLGAGGSAGAAVRADTGAAAATLRLVVPKAGSVTLAQATIKSPKKPRPTVANRSSLPPAIGVYASVAKTGKTWTERFVITNKGGRKSALEDFGFVAVNQTVPGVSNAGVTASAPNVGYLTSSGSGALCTPVSGATQLAGDPLGSFSAGDVFTFATDDYCRKPEKGVSTFFAGLQGTWSGSASFNAVDVATGDFNGDGVQDIAAIEPGTPTHLVLLVGLNDGTFGFPLSLTTSAPPVSLTAGDIDLDGLTDLAVTETTGVEVFSGFFLFGGSVRPIDSGVTNILSVSFGRLNDDAIGDVAVATGNGIDIFDNSASGAFTAGPHLVLPGGDKPVDVTTGDLNGDGLSDIVVLGTDGRGDFAMSESLNSGGTFAPPQDKAFTTADPSIFTPGRENMIFSGHQPFVGFLASGGARIFPFTSGGTLGSEQLFPVGEGASGVVVGDVNGDNLSDVLILNRGAGTVSTYLGQATGTPLTPTLRSSPVGANPVSLSLFNFDGDGKPDLVVANGAGISVLKGSGTGTFTAP